MFKDYYSFKKKDKRIRWVYNRETSEWKRESSPQYSERYLNRYLFWWLSLIGLAFFLVLLLFNLPFTTQIRLRIFGSPLLILVWTIYILCMAFAGIFIRRFIRAVLTCTGLSAVVFFASDILLLNFETPIYSYIASGFMVSLIYILCAHTIRFLLQREKQNDMQNKNDKEKKLL